MPNFDFDELMKLLEEENPQRNNDETFTKFFVTVMNILNPDSASDIFQPDATILSVDALLQQVKPHLAKESISLDTCANLLALAPSSLESTKAIKQLLFRRAKQSFKKFMDSYCLIRAKDAASLKFNKERQAAFYVTSDSNFGTMLKEELKVVRLEVNIRESKEDGKTVILIPLLSQLRSLAAIELFKQQAHTSFGTRSSSSILPVAQLLSFFSTSSESTTGENETANAGAAIGPEESGREKDFCAS